jgi:glycerol-3-phosphate dehydrogenase subunit C
MSRNMTDFVGALDQGTSSTRFAVFDRAGRPIAIDQREYFHGCAANYYEPHVGQAAIDVLERNGFAVIVPPQVCCGLPLISNGLYRQARGWARDNLAVLAGYARAGYWIVGTSTSCTHTIKAEYREMLDIDDADARAVAGATWDICEFLLDLHERGQLDTHFGTLDRTLPYHAPCQLRSHGIGLPALDLFERVRRSGASQAACDSETCRWQIEKATGTSLRHPVEILAEAYAAGDREANRSDPQGAASRLTDQ